jgi:hypothetical protein
MNPADREQEDPGTVSGSGPANALEVALADPACALVVDRALVGGNLQAMVCFGGLSNGTDGAPFEFVRQTGDLGVHRVFVRDLGQCWNQQGLPGTADGVAGTAAHLATVPTVLDGLAPSRRVFVGNSSGAFAAVLFGVLSGADGLLPILERALRPPS